MNKTIIRLLSLTILITGFFSFAAAQKKRDSKQNRRDVKIYLVKEISENGDYDPQNPANLFPVKRRVDAADPLGGALQSLTKGETRAEEKRGLSSGTFGIRFVSVSVENGTALARFTVPENVSFSGENWTLYFIKAVERTALQFPEVKKVSVCLDGELDFGLEDDSVPRRKC